MADFYLLDVIGGGHNKPSLHSQTGPHPSPPRNHPRTSTSTPFKNPLNSDRSRQSQLNFFSSIQGPAADETQTPEINLLRSDTFALHPNLPIIATGAGCMLIIWDLRTDRKTSLIRHTSPITSLTFLTDDLFPSLFSFSSIQNQETAVRGDSLLISVDSGVSPTLCLWNWQDASLLKHSYLPLKPTPRALPIANSLITAKRVRNSCSNQSYQNILGNSMDSQDLNLNEFSQKGNSRLLSSGVIASESQEGLRSCHSLLLVLENQNTQNGGYRLSVWNIGPAPSDKLHHQQQQQQGTNHVQNKENLISHLFASELESSATCLDMCAISNTTSLCSFITIQRTCVKFWHISGLHSIKIKKRVHIKQNIIRVACDTLTGFIVVLSESGKILILDSQGNYISTIQKQNIRFTALECQAAQQVILGTSKGAIEIYNLASLRFVSSTEYPSDLKTRYKLKWQKQMKTGSNSSYSNNLKSMMNTDYEAFMMKITGSPGATKIFASPNYILTSYEDGSLSIYHRPSLAYLRYSSSHSGKVSQVEWLPTSANSAGQFITASHDLTLRIWKHFGDRWTSSYVDIAASIDASLQHFGSQNMTTSRPHALRITCVVAHPKLQYAMCGDNRGVLRGISLQTGQLTITRDLSSFAISKMAFSEDGELLLVAHSTGLVNVYETSTSFAFLLQLEEHFEDASGERFYQTVILSTKKYYEEMMNMKNNFQSIQFSTISSSSPRQYSSHQQQRAYTLHNPTTIRSYALLQHLAKKVSVQLLTEYQIGGGVISGVALHPSNDYLVVLSNAGFILIFRSDTAEIRGRIQVPEFALNCVFDPSGLYVVISAPQPQSSRCGGDVIDDSMISGIDFGGNKNNSSLQSSECMRLLVFEVGTGNFCSQITSLFKISTFSWSRDGRFLVICGEEGIVSVWGVAESLSQNIFRMIDAVRLDPNCWTAYPIYLDNSFDNEGGGPVQYGERNQIVTEIDIEEKKRQRQDKEERKRRMLSSLPISSRRQNITYEDFPKNKKRPDYEIIPDDRSVRSVHSLHPDYQMQELDTYYRKQNKGFEDNTTEFKGQKNQSVISTSSNNKNQLQLQLQSRFNKISTPLSINKGGVGVQTSNSLIDDQKKKRPNNNTEKHQQYMRKQSISHMAQRFTRDMSDSNSRYQQSDRKQKLGRNEQLYHRNKNQNIGTPRSAMSAIISNKNNFPFQKEGINTKSISHIPQRDQKQMTPRTLQHSFLIAKKQQQQQQSQQVQRSVQKRRYHTPGRDLLDHTNAKALYGNAKVSLQRNAPPQSDIRKSNQNYDRAISTLLDEEKQYSGMLMNRETGKMPQGFVNRSRDIRPDPEDIDDDIEVPYVEHALNTLSPLVSSGIYQNQGDFLLLGVPRPPQKQVLVLNSGLRQSKTKSQIEEMKMMSNEQKPSKSYELGVGQGLQNVKNYDPLLGRALSNKGAQTQSHRSTADVVEQLYQDLDAFQIANLPPDQLQQQSSQINSMRDDIDDDDDDFQR